MSPRPPAVLREGDQDRTVREHLIEVAARMLASGRGPRITVRAIADEAGVADGVLYNHFADKDELLAQALLHHVELVMHAAHDLPQPGTGTVEENLRVFVRVGIDILSRVTPAFALMLSQPHVLEHFRLRMAGDDGTPGLPHLGADYLRREQQLGRIAPEADPDAVATLLVGACHDLVVPRLLFDPSGTISVSDEQVTALVRTVWTGVSPPAPGGRPASRRSRSRPHPG